VFDKFSDRARRVIFLARKDAGRRGTATTIEPAHLLDALVREDQGEFARMMPDVVRMSGQQELRPAHPFFSAEAASAVLATVQRVLPPKAEPVPLSTDMPASPAFSDICTAARDLANDLHHNRVEPLHLLAVMVADESTGAVEILKQHGITREAVIAAIQS